LGAAQNGASPPAQNLYSGIRNFSLLTAFYPIAV
jgi:hypothetical protein